MKHHLSVPRAGVVLILYALILILAPPAISEYMVPDMQRNRLRPAAQQTPMADAVLTEQANQVVKDAEAHYDRGDMEGALARYQQALALYRRANNLSRAATTLGSIGGIYDDQGQYKAALEHYQQAVDIQRKLGDRAGVGTTLNNIGLVYNNQSQYSQALDVLQEALTILREVRDLAGEGSTLNNIGLVHDNQGRYAQALDYYQQALAIQQRANDRAGLGATLTNIGALHAERGEYAAALASLQQAMIIQRELNDRRRLSTTLNNIASIYTYQGRYAQALEHFQQALTIAQELRDPMREGRTLNNIGGVYSAQGQYSRALTYFQQALSIKQTVNDRAGVATTLTYIGDTYEKQGEYARALDYHYQALAIGREIGDPIGVAGILNSIGLVYQAQGLYDRALDNHQQALAIQRQMDYRVGTSGTFGHIAHLFDQQGQYEQALGYYQQALAIQQQIGDGVAVSTIGNMGLVYYHQGQYAPALESFQQALAIMKKLGRRADEGAAWNNIGLIHYAQGRYVQALECFQQALAIKREVGDQASAPTTLTNIGRVYEQQGELARALDFYQQAIAVQEQVRTAARLEELKIGVSAQLADTYERAVLLLTHQGQSRQAFDLSERARARAFLDQLGNTRLDLRQNADPRLVQQEQDLRLELIALETRMHQLRAQPLAQQDATAIQILATQRAAKQREYEDVLTQLQLSNPAYAALVTIAPLTLTQTQQLVPADTTLLSYFVTTDKTLAFLVTRNSFQAVELPVREQELYDAIREFGDAPRSGNDNEVPPSLRRLYDWLIAPLKMHLTTPVVGIIPHGRLHYLPFAALTDGQHYLVDDYTLFTLPSASTLSFLQPKPDTGEASLLAFAQGQAEGLPPLRYAEQEAETIAQLYNTQAVVGGATTETDFKLHAGDYTNLHLAAHGQLIITSPLFSRIVLTSGNNEDGALEVHEIYGLDLHRTELVVLSACQTELGARSRGDDIVGLSRAFLYAGAPTVIASLWSVDDQATSSLMTAFYTHLKSGLGPAAALRAAQQETRAQYPHPYYWAAFTLTGDPGSPAGPGSGPQAPLEAIWFLAAVPILLLVLLGLVWWRKRRQRIASHQPLPGISEP